MSQNFTKYAFTDGVKRVQERRGSRDNYARMEQSGDRYQLTPHEAQFIAARDSFYLSTVGENGWPYMQFRGGPTGFLRVLDAEHLAFADFKGNRQYISTGNIETTRKACLFLMDYPHQQRLKIWAEAEILEGAQHAELLHELADPEYPAKIERAIRFKVCAYDWNCPQHITPRYTEAEIRALRSRGEEADDNPT